MLVLSQPSSLPAEVLDLCDRLARAATELDLSGHWPAEQLEWCAAAGVYRWFLPEQFGGWSWSEQQILEGYLALSQSCLTTTFVLTQWNAACRRILGCGNEQLKRELLPRLASGEVFATVGISHLTTSRQHVGKPALQATAAADEKSYELNGFSPWVTGGAEAGLIVLGATLADGRQLLAAVPTDRAGMSPKPGARLLALSASCTDQVDLDGVRVDAQELLAGPVLDVMQTSGGGAGGLQTSTLAIGLATSAVQFLKQQAERRAELEPVAVKMDTDTQRLRNALFELTAGKQVMTASELRQQANSLVLRSTQAALQAAKGAGFIATHPTGRWAREAMFFLVWSCPQPVAQANLCELAQLN